MECLMDFKDIPPLYSTKIINLVKNKGSPELCRKYLEYLTMKYKVSESKYHTELAISYINEITDIVSKKYMYGDEIDIEEVENDQKICELRAKLMRFLETSRKYHLNLIFIKLPYEYMLPEMAFILACDKQYTKAFEICVRELGNVSFSKTMCDKIYGLLGDDSIFLKLFEVYYENGLTDAAIDLLTRKIDVISHEKVLKLLKGDERLSEKHFNILRDIVSKVEK